ncbi:MAG: dihydroxyacetone kinase subunit DhaL [Anaerolineae bacterium]
MNWIEILRAVSQTYEEKRQELDTLDAALGDGDHGTTLSTAFKDAYEKAAQLKKPLPADVLRVVAQTLTNPANGAAGALYGTLFLRASLVIKDKTELSGEDMLAMWQAGLDGVIQRGGAHVGDKTIVDALEPAVAAFADAVQKRLPVSVAFEAAAAAARFGAIKTIDRVAKHGRAKFSGERSLGHLDAGAVSVSLLFETLRNCWHQEMEDDDA